MNIILTLLVISLSILAVMILGVLVWAMVVSVREPSVSERPSKRTQPCYVLDDEDDELSPCELVMKYSIPLTDAEFERMMFDRHYANQLCDKYFVQPQRDMDMAMHTHQVTHQMAHQMAVDAHCVACQQAAELHNQAHDMALHDAQMHNDMFNNCGNPFF